MRTFRGFRKRLWGALRGGRRDNDLADEIASHLDMQIQDNLRSGLSPEEARRAARLKFGAIESIKESYRDQRGLPWLEEFFADLRHALRGLSKSYGFTSVTVLTLALGIGAVTAVFSLVNQVLLAPPGIRNPDRVIAIQTHYRKLHLDLPVSSPRVLADLHDRPEVFQYAALMALADANYTAGGDPQILPGAVVTSEWFDVFGAKPLLGRVFRKEEDQPNANRVVVLSHAAWSRLFGADPMVLGRSMVLNQVPRRIIGVMPPDFRWPRNVDVWAPVALPEKAFSPAARYGSESYFVVARIRPDSSSRQAGAWLGILTARVHQAEGQVGAIAGNYGWSLSAIPFTETAAGETKKPLLVLFGAVALVLLIVCLNIAGLLLARGSARAHEFAVRAALGAGRGRLLRSLFAEALLLAVAGGAAGMALAYEVVKLLMLLAPQEIVSGIEPHPDFRVLMFCVATSIAAAVLFGIAPAFETSRPGQSGALRTDDRSSTFSRGRQNLRSILVVAEAALALILLVAAGLLLQSFLRLQGVNPGFEPRGVMTAVYALPQQSYSSASEQAAFSRTVLDRLNHTPGVAAAALGTPLPFGGSNESDVFEIEGQVLPPGEPLPHGEERLVTPGYFRTLGIPLERGRDFTDADRAASERVALIDEILVRQYWKGADPLGARILWRREWYRIVGVVGHVKHSNLASDNGKGVYYFSIFQQTSPVASILVKTNADLSSMPDAIRDAVRETDPRQAVRSFRSMEDLVADSLAPRRFGMRLTVFFGAVALFLAALGLYGVLSYSVTQRRREIGIRMALGAERLELTKLVVGQGLRLAAAGAVFGTIGSAALARLIRSLLFEVRAFDLWMIAGTAAVLLSAAMLASYLPGRRATQVDPVVALRPE